MSKSWLMWSRMNWKSLDELLNLLYTEPREGVMSKDFRVEFYPKVGALAVYESEHETMEEAVAVLDAIANYTLLLHECSLMPDYSNTGMLFKKKTSGWVEIGTDGFEI